MTSIEKWKSLAQLLAELEETGEDGAVSLIKIDGGREKSRFTVFIEGGRSAGGFRKDGDDLGGLLKEALAFYRSQTE